jgi:release factor glutamine methyltransferase
VESIPGSSDVAASDTVVARLRAAGCVYAEEEAALLLETIADGSAFERGAGLEPGGPVDRAVVRRERGEPLEQILGWAEFCGHRVVVEPGVFVPRRRTEFLVECAVQHLAPGDRVLDLCCGAGGIALAITHAVPELEVYATDVDAASVAAARRNLQAPVPPGHSIGRVYEGDLFAAVPHDLRGTFRVITVNAPHVPTAEIPTLPSEARDHEHLAALDGGADGLDLYRRIADEASAWLRPGGCLVVEAARHQCETAQAIFADAGFTTTWARDDEREATVVTATVVTATMPAGEGRSDASR